MLCANKLLAAGAGLAAVLLRRAANVELDWDTRQKSRFEAVDSQGRHVGVFLPRGSIVRGGAVLVGEEGSLIAVKALPQPVLVVTAEGSLLGLLRAAYHLGNRHVPLEVKADRLQPTRHASPRPAPMTHRAWRTGLDTITRTMARTIMSTRTTTDTSTSTTTAA